MSRVSFIFHMIRHSVRSRAQVCMCHTYATQHEMYLTNDTNMNET